MTPTLILCSRFHRFARRERIRKQLKEFEELQEKDPEAALERLAEIEKQRVLERASLRHRSTGKWAQNHAVRAKYDKEVLYLKILLTPISLLLYFHL